VVIANAQVHPDYDWSKEAYEPGVVSTLLASFNAALNILNTETVALARRGFMKWGDRINARRGPTLPKVTVHFATLTFDNIQDAQERSYFNAMPTNLNLPDYQVDQVRLLARRLLHQSPDFQRFLATMQ
jgi:NTE family protein